MIKEYHSTLICSLLSSLSFLQGSGSQHSGQRNSSELGSGLLSRWLSSHYHGGVHDEKSVAHHTVNLLTSTIKVDADQSDLRFCFRIISPTKSYTLQVNCYRIFIWISHANHCTVIAGWSVC